jgi:hypothetical protein
MHAKRVFDVGEDSRTDTEKAIVKLLVAAYPFGLLSYVSSTSNRNASSSAGSLP